MLTESSLDKDLVKNLIGKNLLIYIKREIDGEKIKSIEDLKCNYQKFVIDNKIKLNMNIKEINDCNIRTIFDIEDTEIDEEK